MRVRPLMMTVFAIIAGLLPIMWGTGTGSEVMRRIAAPMVGGMISATILTLIVIPAIYALVKEFTISRARSAAAPQPRGFLLDSAVKPAAPSLILMPQRPYGHSPGRRTAPIAV